MLKQVKVGKTLVLGIGNPILSDDGVGILIARRLKEASPGLEVVETSEAGLSLLEYADGYDKLIVIDSIKTKGGKPGTVYKLGLADIKKHTDIPSFHGVNIATAFELGKGLGYRLPGDVCLYAVEIKDNLTFAEECTPEVRQKVPQAVKQIRDEENL